MGLAICGRKTVKRLLGWSWLMPADASWSDLLACPIQSIPKCSLSSPCLAIFCVGLRQAPAATGEAPVAMQTFPRLFRSWKNSKQGYSNNGCLLFQLLTRIDLQHWASDRLRSSEIEEGLEIFARHRFRTGNAAQVCVFCRQYASCQPSHA